MLQSRPASARRRVAAFRRSTCVVTATRSMDCSDGDSQQAGAAPVATAFDESQATWGLQMTPATASSHSGNGVRLAVLDTGLDLAHPDFAGRAITERSFVAGEATQ